ncbi:MAG: hypothetical protein WA705_11310 [Candidatus Ozemobacteraceae bacterium]
MSSIFVAKGTRHAKALQTELLEKRSGRPDTLAPTAFLVVSNSSFTGESGPETLETVPAQRLVSKFLAQWIDLHSP